jgi:osmotically inducible protein OsmC
MSIELTKVNYTTAAHAKGGRAGHVRSEDGVIDLDLAQPGTSDEPKANPETLFASGFAACFQSALMSPAKAQGVDASDSEVTATVFFGPSTDGGFGLAVELAVHIPDLDEETTEELIELAHQFCPYSKATRGNIEVTLSAF